MKFYDFDELEKEIPQEIKMKAKKKTQEMSMALSLAEIRTALGVTQVELAERLNVKQSAISKIEKREGISLSKLSDIAKALGGQIEIKIKVNDKEFALNPEHAV